MSELDASKEAALNAAANHGGRSLVFITDERAELTGSGVLFRTRGDRTIVVTAKHVFEKDDELLLPPEHRYQLGFAECWDALRDPFDRPILPSSGLDVVAVPLRREASTLLVERALAISELAPVSNVAHEWFMVCGFPASLRVSPTAKEQLFGSIAYVTKAYGPDHSGDYMFEWKDAIPNESGVAFGWEPGQVRRLSEPGGSSGGSLWQFWPSPDEEWRPGPNGRLVAITSAFDGEVMVAATGINRWLEWLVQVADEVDRRED